MDKKTTLSSNQQVRSLLRVAMQGIKLQNPREEVLKAILEVAHTTPRTA